LKKLKKKLLYSFIIIVISIITILRINYPFLSIYQDETQFVGKIVNIKQGICTQLEVKAKEKILVFDCDNNSYEYGMTLKINGTLEKPKNSITFNYQNYLLSKKIHYTIYPTQISVLEKTNNFFYVIKNKIHEKIENYKSEDYLKAFVLGSNDLIDKETIESYRDNGISHLFAISGMHITLLSSILFMFLNKMIKKRNSTIIISAFLLFYVFITNFSPSVIRAVLMFILLNITKEKSLKIIICLFFLMILINPFYFYNLGFCFSYAVTFFLIYFKKIYIKQKNFLVKTFIISFIAFLASMPILIKNFNEINLLSPFLNLIFVPMVSTIIYPFSLLTFLFKIFDRPFDTVMMMFEKISIYFSEIDFFIITLKEISIMGIIIYFVIVFMSLKNKKYLLILLFVLLLHININKIEKNFYMTVIDVGQGDSILLKLPSDKGNILIDTGGNFYSNGKLSETKIIPYLKYEGVKKIDYLVVSHGDYDHMGEAINLVNNFKVERVIFNCGPYNDLEQDLIKVLEKNKIVYYSCIKELNINDNKLYFLNNKDYRNENDNSSVIYTELNNHKFLFMGDAGVEVEEDLIEKYNLKDIDVLKVGHHGSRTSSSKNFISEIDPKYSIISVGKNNRYGHPNDSVLDNLKYSQIYRTDYDGSIMFKIKKDKLKIETCAP